MPLDTPQMATPIVHLNGTSADELLAQHLAVRNAIKALSSAMLLASPHARDYPEGFGDAANMFGLDVAAYRSRLMVLDDWLHQNEATCNYLFARGAAA